MSVKHTLFARLSIGLFLSLFISSAALAAESGWAEDRMQVDLGLDEDGKTAPEAFVPFDWGDGWSSGLGFRSRQSDSNDTLTGYTDSRFGTSVSEDRLRLNIFTYENKDSDAYWAFGADIEQITIDQTEFGYFQMPNPYAPNPAVAGEYVAFDSQIDVVVTRPNIFTDYTSKGDAVDFRVGLSVSPTSNFSVDQETRFVPLISTTGTSSGTDTLDLSYELTLELEYKTGGSVNIGIGYYYEFLPITYDIATLNNTADGFNTQTIDREQVTTRTAVRIIFNKPISGNLKPVIGYIIEDIETTDVSSGSSETESKNIISFGLESRF